MPVCLLLRPPPAQPPIGLCAAEMCQLAPRELCVLQLRKESPFPGSFVRHPAGTCDDTQGPDDHKKSLATNWQLPSVHRGAMSPCAISAVASEEGCCPRSLGTWGCRVTAGVTLHLCEPISTSLRGRKTDDFAAVTLRSSTPAPGRPLRERQRGAPEVGVTKACPSKCWASS